MKYIISLLVLLFSFTSFACMNKIPRSEAIKAMSLEPNAGSKTCAELPDDPCYCYDGIDWHSAEEAEEVFFDFENEILCETEEECSLRFAEYSCAKGERKNYGTFLRCEWESRREKKLVNNPVKKAAREQKEKEAEIARNVLLEKRNQAKERVKLLDLNKTLTTKQITDALKDFQEIIREEE